MPIPKPSTSPATGQSSRLRHQTDDGRIVARVLGGEREAYSTLVSRHQAMLYHYARGMGFDYDSACDLVQDAFLRAYEKLGDCRKPDRFRAWLLRILRNRCLDQRKNAAERGIPLEAAGELPAAAPQPELRRALGDALAVVPEDLREAFLLKHVEGWSYEEMAVALGASISALKMRVHRARDLLRRALDDAACAQVM